MPASDAKQHASWRILVFFGVITAFFYVLIVATMPKYASPSTPEEVARTDLSKECICLDSSNAEVYPGVFYQSADFAGNDNSQNGTAESESPESNDLENPTHTDNSPESKAAADSNQADERQSTQEPKYETCRIVLDLKAGTTYGITGQTATYAQRVYVNGELLDETGTLSANPATFYPETDFYTVYFTPQSNQTEIIVQHAWFNHASGAFHKIYLAEQDVITNMNRAQTLCDGLITGSLLAMALFFFGMFLFNLAKREMLWLSLSCLVAALNYLIYESKQIMTFFPSLDWYVGHKIELITNICYFLFIALFAFTALNVRPKKRTSMLLLSVVGAVVIFYVAAPSTFYSQYTVPIGAGVLICGAVAACALLRASIKAHLLSQPDRLFVCLSPLLTVVVYFIESVTYFSHVFYLRAYFMVLLAFCNALVLTIGYARTEHSLSEAKRHEREIAEENALLEKMNDLKGDFMRNLAHEMKTPLTVMSGYAQLTERQIKSNAVDGETTANLETIAREAGRLSNMVAQLLTVTYQSKEDKEHNTFGASELLHDASAICKPILLKNNNRLEMTCETSRKLKANKEALLQVIANLCINSNKHTRDGAVEIAVYDANESDSVTFAVRDNGSGICEEDLPHVFDRGYSKDGDTGLGLTICREIVESVGGEISVESTAGKGTTIRFTVPAEGKAASL